MIAVLIAASLFAGISIWRDFHSVREQARARIQSVSELRAAQVESWIERQMTLAGFLAGSALFAEWFERWQTDRDEAAGARLLARAADFRKANEGDSVLLVDAEGTVLAWEHAANRAGGAVLTDAVKRALAQATPTHTGVYRRDDRAMPLCIDIVVPLLQSAGTPRGAVVLRIDPRRALFPMLAGWPVPSESGETVLWRRLDAQVVTVSDVRHQPDGSGRFIEPLATSRLLPAKVLPWRGDEWRCRSVKRLSGGLGARDCARPCVGPIGCWSRSRGWMKSMRRPGPLPDGPSRRRCSRCSAWRLRAASGCSGRRSAWLSVSASSKALG